MPTLTSAFYGKIASEADFVRLSAGSFQQAGWDAWFQEGLAHLQRLGLALPQESVRFVLDAGAGRLCLGAFAPSQDAHARAFPAIVSLENVAPPVRGLAAWREQRESFFAAAAFLAWHAPRFTVAELHARLPSVASRLENLPVSPAHPKALIASRLGELLGQDDLADLAYGLTTTLAACSEARRPTGPGRSLTLHAPIHTEIRRSFWIDLVGRQVEPVMPSVFWTEHHLVIALGRPSSSMFVCLADPLRAGPRCWSLGTPKPSARAAAISRLSLVQAHLLGSPETNLTHLLSVFSREQP